MKPYKATPEEAQAFAEWRKTLIVMPVKNIVYKNIDAITLRQTKKNLLVTQWVDKVGEITTRYSPYNFGDEIYVQEEWVRVTHDKEFKTTKNKALYKVDSKDTDGYFWPSVACDKEDVIWQPANTMPEWASRTHLTVKNVTVCRLHELTGTDIRAIGLHYVRDQWTKDTFHRHPFKKHWNKKHPNNSWDSNPWVYKVEVEKTA